MAIQLERWYKAVTPRDEVRKGRSFNPDEFAIHLEQVVAGTAPDDYKKPGEFFARTCWTSALTEHSVMALRRLAGETESTAPVLALVTQFGGGKTHTLTALYHLIKNGKKVESDERVKKLLKEARLPALPKAQVAVFVGNAWDPGPGTETPWVDIARQLAGGAGAAALGAEAKKKAPGTNNLRKLFEAAGGNVLILCDEVLNFLSRHRDRAEAFRDFMGNLVRALTGTTGGAALISLPKSKEEMTEWDERWQEIITKEVNRVAKNLIANDETEISEVIRRRLFEDIGDDKARQTTARAYANWCFERRAQLPPEWTAVDTASTETKAREFLRARFEACYPFHPATLSVFQRKWQALHQYQRTRGTLAMFAQWISWAYRDGFQQARPEPLITLGSAPLHVQEFRGMILGQLGEARLSAAIETDIAGAHAHARALDADTKGPLKDIHRRVAAAILFESSGGQVDKVAHLPELRFALGEPQVDTTSIDNAAFALESKAFFISRVGSDGFKVYHKATIRKAVSDRRASLDEDSEVLPTMAKLVREEFERGSTVPLAPFPTDGSSVADSPKLTLVLLPPNLEWSSAGKVRKQIAEWTKVRGQSSRLYPASLIWCLKKPGRELRDKVELWLAWKKVAREVAEGSLGSDFDRTDRADLDAKLRTAESDARDEVWATYRFVVFADNKEADGLNVIDLGAGHASGSETLCGRIIAALKSRELLNESVGAGYLERRWPPALKQSGAWPLSSLRQSFLNGTFTRLLDPDTVLRTKIVEFVARGDLGLASVARSDGTYERVWQPGQIVPPDEVMFDANVFLLTKTKAESLKPAGPLPPQPEVSLPPEPEKEPEPQRQPGEKPPEVAATKTLRVVGNIPPETWNRFGTKVLPKLKAGKDLVVGVDFSVSTEAASADQIKAEVEQILNDLNLAAAVEARIL